MAADLERKMREAAANLEFEKAAALRDELIEAEKAGRRQRRASSSAEKLRRSWTKRWPNWWEADRFGAMTRTILSMPELVDELLVIAVVVVCFGLSTRVRAAPPSRPR